MTHIAGDNLSMMIDALEARKNRNKSIIKTHPQCTDARVSTKILDILRNTYV